MNSMSSSQVCVRLTKSLIESKMLSKKYFRNLGTYTLVDRGQLICRDHAIWLHCFSLQNGRASKTNIISTSPGKKQFIPAHVEDAKGVFHEMCVHKTVTIFRNLRSLMLFDVG